MPAVHRFQNDRPAIFHCGLATVTFVTRISPFAKLTRSGFALMKFVTEHYGKLGWRLKHSDQNQHRRLRFILHFTPTATQVGIHYATYTAAVRTRLFHQNTKQVPATVLAVVP